MPQLRPSASSLTSILLALLATSGSIPAADAAKTSAWMQWRGAARDAVLAGDGWPDGLTRERLTRLWRQELGPSYSGPIVAGDRVFTTETRDEKTEHVRAFDLLSGKPLWETRWDGAMQVAFMGSSGGSWIRSTPACDGERLYVLGMRDVLVGLDAATGKELWRVDFPKQFKTPVPDFGGVSSPLVLDGAVFVQAGSGLAKVDARTGAVLWRSVDDGGGKSANGAFSSAAMATIAGTPQVIALGREQVRALAPDTGAVLWKQPAPTMFGMNIATPILRGDQVLISAFGGTFLCDPTVQPVRILWKNSAQGDMSTAVRIGDHVYALLRGGRFACLDLTDGTTRWKTRPMSEYLSLVAQGGRILALSERGDLRLIAANPQRYELLGEAQVSDLDTWAHLAVVGDLILIRDLAGVTAWRWR